MDLGCTMAVLALRKGGEGVTLISQALQAWLESSCEVSLNGPGSWGQTVGGFPAGRHWLCGQRACEVACGCSKAECNVSSHYGIISSLHGEPLLEFRQEAGTETVEGTWLIICPEKSGLASCY